MAHHRKGGGELSQSMAAPSRERKMRKQALPHNPGKLSERIGSTRERALQRAILASGRTILGDDDVVEWLDCELPVESGVGRKYKRLDLIGKDSRGNYVLCELKFSGKSRQGADNPIAASEQLKEYRERLWGIAETFRFHEGCKEKELDASRFKSGRTRLMVAADRKYWETWKRKWKKLNDGICCTLHADIEYYSIDVDAEAFKKQRESQIVNGDSRKYRPVPPPGVGAWRMITGLL